VTSADMQQGDLRVTLCTRAVDGSCQAAVTAEYAVDLRNASSERLSRRSEPGDPR
jgi:hypothetical protein